MRSIREWICDPHRLRTLVAEQGSRYQKPVGRVLINVSAEVARYPSFRFADTTHQDLRLAFPSDGLDSHVMTTAAVVLAAAIFISYPTGQAPTPLTADIDAVVAAGKITANQYQNDYFALSVTAYDGVIQAPSLVNRAAQRARLADASSNAKMGEKRYSVGLLVDAQAKNPLIHSPE